MNTELTTFSTFAPVAEAVRRMAEADGNAESST